MTGVLLVVLLIVIVAVVAIAGALIAMYNGLVKLNIKVEEAWSGITVQLKRRADMIPNLVETVKGYAAHESTVFTEVSQARAQAGGVMHMDENLLSDEKAIARFQEAQNSLGGALQRLLSISENYPELKANEQFLALQNQLEGTENRIAVERKRFNESVQQYNKTIRMFPQNIVANMGGFTAKAYFSADEKASSAPAVSF